MSSRPRQARRFASRACANPRLCSGRTVSSGRLGTNNVNAPAGALPRHGCARRLRTGFRPQQCRRARRDQLRSALHEVGIVAAAPQLQIAEKRSRSVNLATLSDVHPPGARAARAARATERVDQRLFCQLDVLVAQGHAPAVRQQEARAIRQALCCVDHMMGRARVTDLAPALSRRSRCGRRAVGEVSAACCSQPRDQCHPRKRARSMSHASTFSRSRTR